MLTFDFAIVSTVLYFVFDFHFIKNILCNIIYIKLIIPNWVMFTAFSIQVVYTQLDTG